MAGQKKDFRPYVYYMLNTYIYIVFITITQETKVPVLAILVCFQPVFLLQIQAYLALVLQCFPVQGDIPFQHKFCLLLAKGWCGVKSNTSENISGYYSNSRYSFICCENIIQYKVFSVLGSIYFPLQGGNILQFKVAPVLGLAVLCHVPIQGHEFQYKVKIYSNSRLPPSTNKNHHIPMMHHRIMII